MHQDINIILEGCKNGNRRSQMQMYDRYSQAMFNVAMRYLNNSEDAKDAMQEGFLKAFKHIKTYQPAYSFGAWLKRIIINHCIDVIKQRRILFTEIEPEQIAVVDSDSWEFDSSITKDDIISAIQQLPEKYKIVVNLYLLEGFDHEEISQVLCIPRKTSRTQLKRGKEKLRLLLKETYDEARY